MANVADRQDNMEAFFKGIQALQTGADQLIQYQMLNKKLDMEKSIAEMKYSQDSAVNSAEATRAQAFLLQQINSIGIGEPDKATQAKAGIVPGSFDVFTKEARQAKRDEEVAGVKHEFKTAETEQTYGLKSALQAGREQGLNQRQLDKIAAIFAEKGITPKEASAGVSSTQELTVKPDDQLRPIEVLFEKSGLFGMGKQQLNVGDVIDMMGTKELMDKEGKSISKYDYLKKAFNLASKNPSRKKDILDKLTSDFPQLKDVLNRVR